MIQRNSGLKAGFPVDVSLVAIERRKEERGEHRKKTKSANSVYVYTSADFKSIEL